MSTVADQSESHHAPPPDASPWTAYREVLVISGPIILGSLSYTVMDFADKWMVSKLGTDALAAIGSASLASYTLSSFVLGMVSVVSTFVAQSVGRNNPEHCGRYAWQGLYLAIVAGLVAIALWPLTRPLFGLMNHAETVTQLEVTYFETRLLGYVPLAWATAFAAFFQAISKSTIPMYAAFIANGINVLLNYLLIFGAFGFPELGVQGAAVATVIAQFLHAGLLFVVFASRPIDARYRTRDTYVPDLTRLRELFRIGWPAGVEMFLEIANWAIFTSFVVGYFGAAQLAAHNIAISFMLIAFMPVVGMNQGVAALVAQWVGRGDIPRAKGRAYAGIRIAIAHMLFMSVVFYLFGERMIAATFSDEPKIVELGGRLLMLAVIFQTFDGISIVCMGALRGVGDTKWMMVMTIVLSYFVLLPMSYLLAFTFGGEAYGAWAGATMYIIPLSGILFWRFQGERWRDINIFAVTESRVRDPEGRSPREVGGGVEDALKARLE